MSITSIHTQIKHQKESPFSLLSEEHTLELSNRLNKYKEEKLNLHPAPFFTDEILLDRKAIYQKFEFLWNENLSLQSITIKDILLAMGMRVTSASVFTKEALPPKKEKVLKASFAAYNSQISKAVRAFEKHALRHEDNFWGAIKGSPAEKEIYVKDLFEKMFSEITWWNVFYHYKHELVYEIRIASGHGMRWKLKNLELIGFLEPFLEE